MTSLKEQPPLRFFAPSHICIDLDGTYTPVAEMASADTKHRIVGQLMAHAPQMLECLRSCERVFVGWVHDENPHGDLQPGESPDFDAATLMLESVRSVINNATR